LRDWLAFRARPDRRHGSRPERTADRCRKLGFRQGQARGVVIGRRDVPAAGIEQPLRDVQPAAGPECQLYLPAAVSVFPRVPLSVFRVGTQLGKAFSHDLPKAGAGRGISLAAYGRALRLLGHVGALGEHGALEPAHSLDRDAGRVRDLFRRLPGADSCLDLLGSQGILHFDLVLGEP
jgi:hypothetical protein